MRGWKWSFSWSFVPFAITALNKQPHWHSCERSLKPSIYSLINVWPNIKHKYIYFTLIRIFYFTAFGRLMSNFIVHNVANVLLALPQNENRSLEQKSRYQKQEVSNISLVHVIISKVADNYAVKNVWRSQNGYSSHQKSIQFISLHASPHFWRDRCFILEELFNKDPFFLSWKSWSFDQIAFVSSLQLIHPHVIDTSLLYRREFGQRFKLKVLAETVLGWVLLLSLSPSRSFTHPPQLLNLIFHSCPRRQIQTEERMGHNPTEDAVAALELAQYFIKTGPRQVTTF